MAPSRLWLLCLGLAAAAVSEAAVQQQQQHLLPALREVSASLIRAERDGDWTAVLQAQNALWPAVEESLHPLLDTTATAERRRLARAGGASMEPPLGALSQAMALLSRYGAKLLQLEALDVEQTISNSLKAALGIPVNESALAQTEAATKALEDAMSAVVLQSMGTSASITQAAGERLAQRLAAFNAATASIESQLRDTRLNWHSMTEGLIGQLTSAMTGSAAGSRRLQEEQHMQEVEQVQGQEMAEGKEEEVAEKHAQEQEQEQAHKPGHKGPEAAAERLHALAERLQQLRADRAALRARLREALHHTSSSRRLHQAAGLEQEEGGEPGAAFTKAAQPGEAPIIEPTWWVGEEERELLAPLWQDGWQMAGDASGGDGGQAAPSYIVLQEVGMVPAASQLLLTDMLFLVRDALDLALGFQSPTPSWAAAYGYRPKHSAFYPLEEPEPLWKEESTAAARTLSQAAARLHPPLPTEGPHGAHRRLRSVGASAASGAELADAVATEGTDEDYNWLEDDEVYEYGDVEGAAYDDAYDESYYESDADDDSYYGEEYDWMFDDPEELYLALVKPSTAPTATTAAPLDASGKPTLDQEQVPSLPVFAVWTGSSHAGVVPSSAPSDTTGHTAVQTAQPLELIVPAFSAGARTPVPHIDAQPGPKFDARLFGAVASAALVTLLLLAAAVAMLRARRSSSNADQQESLLYSHIPGTPGPTAAAPREADNPWTAGNGGTAAVQAIAAPVTKKLSNLPA